MHLLLRGHILRGQQKARNPTAYGYRKTDMLVEWRVLLQGQIRCGSCGECLGNQQVERQHSIDRGMLSGRSRLPGRDEVRRRHRELRWEEIG
jgi:hypothetical protein